MTRRVFYSFNYKPDVMRASQVRQIGALDGSQSVKDNDWETITNGGDPAIARWIAQQMKGRSCTVVLVGQGTAKRKWINHEIIESWKAGMGIVGIRIHGLKNTDKFISKRGKNPFDYLSLSKSKKKLSSILKCYDPEGSSSKERYNWISQYLEDAVEEAIQIRKNY